MPPYVKILLDNQFPRSQVTTHIARTAAMYYGPFRSRAAADEFEARFLDLFQLRRCQEELAPSPDHPGCIYGEMGMCLRPCQQVVGPDEYRHEVGRVEEFLRTSGKSLLQIVTTARDRLSAEMNFEEASRQHKRLEKVESVLRLRDDLARDLARFHGVAVTASVEPGAVNLWFCHLGWWQAPVAFRTAEPEQGASVSLDQRLRDVVAPMVWQTSSTRSRQEHMAILARWYYSSWRDGEWLAFERPEDLPYRKLVRAISRVGNTARLPGDG